MLPAKGSGGIHPASPKVRTLGDALIRSQASPYKTVGEFLENSSDVREYMRRTDSPAPRRITVRFVVRAVVRMTGGGQFEGCSTASIDVPLPVVLNSDHLGIFSFLFKEDCASPSWNGPTESALGTALCFVSNECERTEESMSR